MNGRSQRRPWVLTRRGDRLVNVLGVLFAITCTWLLWTGFLA